MLGTTDPTRKRYRRADHSTFLPREELRSQLETARQHGAWTAGSHHPAGLRGCGWCQAAQGPRHQEADAEATHCELSPRPERPAEAEKGINRLAPSFLLHPDFSQAEPRQTPAA